MAGTRKSLLFDIQDTSSKTDLLPLPSSMDVIIDITEKRIAPSYRFFPDTSIDTLIENAIVFPVTINQIIDVLDKITDNEKLVKLAKTHPREFFSHDALVKKLTDLELLQISISNIEVMKVLIRYPELCEKIEHFNQKEDGTIHQFEYANGLKNVFVVSKYFDRYVELKAEALQTSPRNIMIWVD